MGHGHKNKEQNREDKILVESLKDKINEKLKNKENVKKAAQLLSEMINADNQGDKK